jgi:hypothetical protein
MGIESPLIFISVSKLAITGIGEASAECRFRFSERMTKGRDPEPPLTFIIFRYKAPLQIGCEAPLSTKHLAGTELT